MAPARRSSARLTSLAAIAVLAVACALVVQDSGPNQAAHFALVRSLADGTAEIDPRETIDAAYVDGRFYAAKAPGLALFTLPWYGALRAVGLQDEPLESAEDYRRRIWELNLFGALLPAVALLVLMFVAVERIAPGFGGATSVLLGAGTLLLPFATLFFDHVLSATLGFAAFVVLFFERDRHPRWWPPAVAGLLAGLAVVVEFPLALVALVLAAYAAAGAARLRQLAAYGVGVLVGVVPLLAYNTWAFGSPTRLSYTNALKAPVGSGAPVVGANEKGLYGVGFPDPRAALSLLFSEKGLAVVTPLVLVALAGLPLLWRSGRRADALVCGVVPLVFLVYNAAYYLPFGGQGPGPRFLVPALPFLALPLALLLRAQPVAVIAIGVASIAVMALATITDPLTGTEYGIGFWLDELRASHLTSTVLGEGWPGASSFLCLVIVGVVLAVASMPAAAVRGTDVAFVIGAVMAWCLVALTTPALIPADEEGGTLEGVVAVLLLVGILVLLPSLVRRRGPVALLLLVPIFVLELPQLSSRPRVAMAVVSVALLAALWIHRRPRTVRGTKQPA